MPIQKAKNENFFKEWSSEMAYVLGFFAADGCMIRNRRGACFIEFHIADEDLLIKIRKLLNSEHKISVRNRNIKWKTAYRLQIGSKEIFKDLLSLGMIPNKSNIIKLPDVPRKYFNHFVRGYFDGDGNVYAGKYKRKNRNNKISITLISGFTSGSRIFLEQLSQEIKKYSKIIRGTLHNRGGAYRLYYSVNDSCKLYEFMYNTGDGLFLERKKKVFKNILRKSEKFKKGP